MGTPRIDARRPLWLSGHVHRELLRLSIPTIVSTLAIPMLGLVDTIVLGRLPDVAQLGAAATTSVIFNTIFWVFGFLRMGTTGLVAQASGRRDLDEATRILFQALFLGVGTGLVLVLFQDVVGEIGFAAMGASARVEELGRSYFFIRIYEAPVFLMTLAITGYLRGRGDALVPMYLTIGVNVVNIIGDLLLVPGIWGLPSLGIRGAAWASLIAQSLGCAAATAAVWPRVRDRWQWGWFRTWRSLPWGRFLFVQRDLFLRTLLLLLSLGAVTAFAARLHVTHELAAHAILLQLWSLVSYGVDGFAYATETTVGHWLGRKDWARAWATANASLLWGLLLSALFSVVYLTGMGWIPAVFTRDPDVQQVVRDLVWAVSVSQPVNALAYIFDGILIGATDTRYLRNAMLASALAFAAALGIGWVWIAQSLAVIWWSLVFFMFMRALTLFARYRSGAWLKQAG